MADDTAPADPRVNTPACRHPDCGALAGDPACYTATGFPRGQHKVRWKPAAPTPEPGSLSDRRPSSKQHDIMRQAMAAGGLYELSGYRFHGDAQRRAAMQPMADPARGWFRRVRDTDHGTLYDLTDAGRNAYYRYQDWMDGGNER